MRFCAPRRASFFFPFSSGCIHRVRRSSGASTTPSADTKLKTTTRVFTFYLCVFRCVIILADIPGSVLASDRILPSSPSPTPRHNTPSRSYRSFLSTAWITRTTIERDPENGKRRRREKCNLEPVKESGKFWSRDEGSWRREGNHSREGENNRTWTSRSGKVTGIFPRVSKTTRN